MFEANDTVRDTFTGDICRVTIPDGHSALNPTFIEVERPNGSYLVTRAEYFELVHGPRFDTTWSGRWRLRFPTYY